MLALSLVAFLFTSTAHADGAPPPAAWMPRAAQGATLLNRVRAGKALIILGIMAIVAAEGVGWTTFVSGIGCGMPKRTSECSWAPSPWIATASTLTGGRHGDGPHRHSPVEHRREGHQPLPRRGPRVPEPERL